MQRHIFGLRQELCDMKIIGVEEHTTFPSLLKRIPNNGLASQIFFQSALHPPMAFAREHITNVGEQRVKDIDESGITIQILSLTGAVNSTHLAETDVDVHPKRFKAFAELPMHAPQEAIKEMHRYVKELRFAGAMLSGSVGRSGKFLDSPEYDAVLSAFEELDVPLYLHPGVPPKSVWNTYYTFPDNPALSAALAFQAGAGIVRLPSTSFA